MFEYLENIFVAQFRGKRKGMLFSICCSFAKLNGQYGKDQFSQLVKRFKGIKQNALIDGID